MSAPSVFSSISCLVGLGALCQVVRRGPQLNFGLGPPEQLNPTMMIAREDKKSHWSNAVLSFLHCWNDRITTRNRNQDACIGNFKLHPKEDAKVSTSLWLTSKHQDGALTLLPERSWQGLSQNAFLLNQTVWQLVQHRPQMVRESDQFIMSLYHIKKAQSLQFKWKKSRRWSKNTSPQCAMFFTECWSFEMFQLCIFSVALSSTSNEGNLCDSRGLNKGWNWTQEQCICLFKEIMTRLLKVVHRPCYEQFHIGTMLYWTTSSNQGM